LYGPNDTPELGRVSCYGIGNGQKLLITLNGHVFYSQSSFANSRVMAIIDVPGTPDKSVLFWGPENVSKGTIFFHTSFFLGYKNTDSVFHRL